MERLDFSSETAYNAIEASIHLNRYAFAKPFCQGAKVLDAACGQGYGSYLMKTWGAQSVVGIDIDEDSVKQASWLFKEDGLTYQQHTVEELPFEDHSFDLVVSFETIEHIDYPEKMLREIKRVLKPGGTIIISCPNDNYYYENDCEKNPFHKREYTFFEFKEMAERNLGYRGEYYLAFALDGFVNIPFEKRTEPEQGTCEDALGMLHYEPCDSALCVPQQSYLNHWNANYYVGVWNGRGIQYRYSTVITPHAFFIDHKDKDYDLLRHFDRMQKELAESKEMNGVLAALRDELAASREINALLDELRAERDDLLEKCRGLDVLSAERDDLLEKCRGLDVLSAERDDLLEKCRELDVLSAERDDLLEKCRELDVLGSDLSTVREENQKLQDELSLIRQEYSACQNKLTSLENEKEDSHGQFMELERLKTLLDLTRRERDQTRQHMQENWGYYRNAVGECDEIKQRYQAISEEYDENKQRYQTIVEEYDEVKQRYQTISAEYDEIKQRYQTISAEYDEIKQRYQAISAECDDVRNAYQMVVFERNTFQNRVNSLESSRGVKLLGKLYNLRQKIKRLLGIDR